MIEIIILETPTILEKLKLSNFSLKINIIKRRKTNGITIGRKDIKSNFLLILSRFLKCK